MSSAAPKPQFRVALDTNVWIWSIVAEKFKDMIALGRDPFVRWLIPWDVDIPGKPHQIMVQELGGKKDKGVSPSHINRLLSNCTQVLMNDPETERFVELYSQFPPAKNVEASRLAFSSQVGDLKRPHEGEIACIVAAEKVDGLFCSKDEDARSFATTIIGEERVFSINALFTMLDQQGIDLPGKITANPPPRKRK